MRNARRKRRPQVPIERIVVIELKITTKLSTNSLVTHKRFAALRLSAVLLRTFTNAITKNQQNSQMAVKLTLKM